MKEELRFIKGLEARVDKEGARSIEGEAAVIDKSTIIHDGYEEYEEVIRAGAFDEAIKGDIRVLKNHSSDLLLGRSKNGEGTAIVYVNDNGSLAFSVPVREKRSHSVDTYDEILSGDLDGCSFAFRVAANGEKWTWPSRSNGRRIPLREITNFEMIGDVGPVTYPYYKDTTTVARSVDAARKEELKPTKQEQRKRKLKLIEIKNSNK